MIKMNCYELIELLENLNVEFLFDEIFIDDEYNEISYNDIDDDIDDKFDYMINNYDYDYDYELVIEIDDDVDVDELKKEIENVDDEIEIVYNDEFELIYRNKE